MHTEDEAKERWCPFSRATTGDDNGVQMAMTSYNRPFGPSYSGGHECQCIASTCMAWRWQPLMADQPFLDAVKARMGSNDDSHPKAVKYVRANLGEYDLLDKPFRGFCGLAQVPLK